MDALLNHPEAQPVIKRKLAEYEAAKSGVEARQLGTGLVPGLVTLLGGTLQAVYDNVAGLIPTNDAVKGLKKFPERMYSEEHHSSALVDLTYLTYSRLSFQGPWLYGSTRSLPGNYDPILLTYRTQPLTNDIGTQHTRQSRLYVPLSPALSLLEQH
jgi:hypothetical protein